jgi:hypothetical protein
MAKQKASVIADIETVMKKPISKNGGSDYTKIKKIMRAQPSAGFSRNSFLAQLYPQIIVENRRQMTAEQKQALNTAYWSLAYALTHLEQDGIIKFVGDIGNEHYYISR